MKSSDQHRGNKMQDFKKNLTPDLLEVWQFFESSSENTQEISSAETEEALSKVWSRINNAQVISNPKPTIKGWIITAAASVLIAAFIGFFYFSEIDIQAPLGEQLVVELSDGSTVLLNGNSTLSYKRNYGLFDRSISINGEAFFDVKSSSKPFLVYAPNTKVEVLGTKFTVLDWEKSTFINPDIKVLEGKVAVSIHNGNQQELVKNEGITLNIRANTLTTYEITDNQKPDWIEGELSFDNLGMNEFFERLELHFGTSINTNNLNLDNEFIRAFYSSDKSLEDILNDVSVVKGYQIKKVHQGYMITQ